MNLNQNINQSAKFVTVQGLPYFFFEETEKAENAS